MKTILLAALIAAATAQFQSNPISPQIPSAQAKVGSSVWLQVTFMGSPIPPLLQPPQVTLPYNQWIKVNLFDSTMPKTVNNFKELCNSTTAY